MTDEDFIDRVLTLYYGYELEDNPEGYQFWMFEVIRQYLKEHTND